MTLKYLVMEDFDKILRPTFSHITGILLRVYPGMELTPRGRAEIENMILAEFSAMMQIKYVEGEAPEDGRTAQQRYDFMRRLAERRY